MSVHVLFENEDWMPPLRTALDRAGIQHQEHYTEGGRIDLSEPPPKGVWVNRMSPSSHTRGHQDGVTLVKELLFQLEVSGSTVINGSRAFALEVSKVRQHAALEAFGIPTPRTIGVVGREGLKQAARNMDFPFITKHNQGGKGLGVQLFRDYAAFDAYVDGDTFQDSPDGITLLQQYIKPAGEHITRVEIVDGVFQYAIHSSTAQGFELCPADACAIDDQMCPVGESPAGLFSLASEITESDPIVGQYIAFMAAHGLRVAGIEFVTDADGKRWTYDINGTTNFNGDVEAEHGKDGMGAIAAMIGRELAKL